MKNTTMKTIIFMLSVLSISQVNAQQYIFPQDGQSKEQQQQDEYTCHSWAVGETGFDPTAAQPQSVVESAPTQPAPKQKSAMRGAIGGAAAGAVIAEVGGNDASNGAAKGAAVGVMANRRQNAKAASQAAEQQQALEQQAAQAEKLSAEQLNNYNEARNVCLDAKGYSISG